jgi:hypothetical protein
MWLIPVAPVNDESVRGVGACDLQTMDEAFKINFSEGLDDVHFWIHGHEASTFVCIASGVGSDRNVADRTLALAGSRTPGRGPARGSGEIAMNLTFRTSLQMNLTFRTSLQENHGGFATRLSLDEHPLNGFRFFAGPHLRTVSASKLKPESRVAFNLSFEAP